MVVRAVIAAVLLLAPAAVAETNLWSTEWTSGTQTNALFIPEARHWRELVLAINERVIAANSSSSDFWGSYDDEMSRGDMAGRQILMLSTNTEPFGPLMTNDLWKPSVAASAAIVGKIVEISSRFMASDNDESFLAEKAFTNLVSADLFLDSVPRWAYGMSAFFSCSNVVSGATNYYACPTNEIGPYLCTRPPLLNSMNPVELFGGQSWRGTNNPRSREKFWRWNLSPATGITGLVLRRAVLDYSSPATNYLGTNLWQLTNLPRSVESVWTGSEFRVRWDTTASNAYSNASVSFILVTANTNHVNMTATQSPYAAFGSVTGTYVDLLPKTFPGHPIVIDMLVGTGTLRRADFPPIVGEWVNPVLWGVSAPSEPPLRIDWSDWVLTWPEMVQCRAWIRLLDRVPVFLDRVKYETGSWGATNTSVASAGAVSCADLLAPPDFGEWEAEDETKTSGQWTWTNIVENQFGPVRSAWEYLDFGSGWSFPLGSARKFSQVTCPDYDPVALFSLGAAEYIGWMYCFRLAPAYTNRAAGGWPRVERVRVLQTSAFEFGAEPYPHEWNGTYWYPVDHEGIILVADGAPYCYMDGAEPDSSSIIQSAYDALDWTANCSSNESCSAVDPKFESGEQKSLRMSATGVAVYEYSFP